MKHLPFILFTLLLLVVSVGVVVSYGAVEPYQMPLSSAHLAPVGAATPINWTYVIIAVLSALLSCSEVQALLPTQSNGIIHLVLLVLKNLKGVPATGIGLMLAVGLMLSGCSTVNLSCLTTTGDNARTSATMRDTDTQNPTTSTTATVPLR